MKKSVIFLLAFFATNSFATPGVEDGILLKQLYEMYTQTKNIIKTANTVKNNYNQAIQIKNNAVKTVQGVEKNFNQLKQINEMAKKHHGFSDKFDNVFLKQWRNSEKSWNSLMFSYKRGDSLLSKEAKLLNSKFGIQAGSTLFKTGKKEHADLYDEMATTTLAAGAQTKLSYESMDKELEMLENLQKQIDKSESEKETLELMARVNLEKAKIDAARIKNEAVLAKLKSLEMQQQVTEAKQTASFLQFRN